MNKIDYLKYAAISILLLILILPEEGTAWIWFLSTAGFLLTIWLFKTSGWLNFWKFFTIAMFALTFIVELGTSLFKWFLWLGIISLAIWTAAYFWLKWE
ncbi:MAG: hypothetical protein PF542_06040 [Nanoarchaeota archaeon]|jgi:hypothetical protein|nr:hypothetical protein [Nanoarchaeota archaeon]